MSDLSKQSKPLNFEDFTFRNPNPSYNNLILYFYTTGIGPVYRATEHFQRFQKENPDLEYRLREGIMALDILSGFSNDLKKFDKDLYDSYLIMRSYGIPDKVLIG